MSPVSPVDGVFGAPVTFLPPVRHDVNPVLLAQLARMRGLAPLLETNAASDPLAGAGGGVPPSSAVELSRSGLLLSALDVAETDLLAAQQGIPAADGQEPTVQDFTAAGQRFADAFNAMGATLNNLAELAAPLNDEFTTTQLIGRFNEIGNQINQPPRPNEAGQPDFAGTAAVATAAPAADNREAAPGTTLAQIGITFQPGAAVGAAGTLAVNPPALQAAFTANPAGAANLVNQATQRLAQQLAGFMGPGGMLPGVQQQLQWGMLFAPGLPNGMANIQGGPPAGPSLAVQQYARIAALAPLATFVGGESSGKIPAAQPWFPRIPKRGITV